MEQCFLEFCIIGRNTLQNELLMSYLTRETGLPCIQASTLPEATSSSPSAAIRIMLFDSYGLNRHDLLACISFARKYRPAAVLLALFNLSPGVPIEKAALKAGVRGFFFLGGTLSTLINGIDVILRGGSFLPANQNKPEENIDAGSDSCEAERLTRRENQILSLLIGGCSNRAIAEQLYISLPTVKTHLNRIFRKIGVKSRLQAVRWAGEWEMPSYVTGPPQTESLSLLSENTLPADCLKQSGDALPKA